VGNVLGYLFRLAFAEEMTASLARLGLSDPAGGTIAMLIALGFAYGIATIWFYAAIRPRFGAGVKTAVIVAVAIWVPVSLLATIQFSLLVIFEGNVTIIGTAADLVGIILATIAGAWVYKE
jgi:hypothetical protein